MDTDGNDDPNHALETARTSLQAVAEHVLSAALHAAIGRIGLRQTPGGFGTPPFASADGQRQIRVAGLELVITDDRGERRAPLSTIGALAAFAEIEPGAPSDVYTPTTALDLDAPLELAPVPVGQLADWYQLVNDALERLRDELVDDEPSIVQLWPEHFDLACTIDGVNYGGSPGDGGIATPYLYVGPHELPPPVGAFWNESFGASSTASARTTVGGTLAFLREGRSRLNP